MPTNPQPATRNPLRAPRTTEHAPRTTEHAPRTTEHVSRRTRCLSLPAFCCLLLAACSFPGSVQPTIKIGLSAPFEGFYRDRGYEALYAVRLAVRQRNEVGGVDGRYLIEMVALNDFGEPQEALVQAHKMAVDPDVLGVLGGLTAEAASSVVGEYEDLGLALLVPAEEVMIGMGPVQAGQEFKQGYQTLSGGAPPGSIAVWAYDSANRLLDAVDAAARAQGRPARDGVLSTLDADWSP